MAAYSQGAGRFGHEVENLEMRLAEMQGLARGRLRLAVSLSAKYDIPRAKLGSYTPPTFRESSGAFGCNRPRAFGAFSENADALYSFGTPPTGMAGQRLRYARN